MSNLIYKYWTKASNKESDSPRRSQNWVISRRAWFKIYDDRIECGNWVLPFDKVTNAILYKTKQMFIPVSILQIETSDQTYQFGFNPWAHPVLHLPFEIKEEKIKLKYSSFSIIVRIVLAVYIVFLLWKYFFN